MVKRARTPSKPRAQAIKKRRTNGNGANGRAAVASMKPQKKNFDIGSFNTRLTQGTNDMGDLLDGACISRVPLGTGQTARIGNSIRICNINFRGILTAPVGGPQTVRLVCVWDKQADGKLHPPASAPTNATNGLIFGTTPVPNTALTTNQFRNLDNVSRFQVLFDQVYDMGLYSGSNAGEDERYVSINLAKLNIPCLFSSGVSTDPLPLSAVRTSAIYLYSNLDETAMSTELKGNTRIKYYDA